MTRNMLNRQLAMATSRFQNAETQEAAENAQAQMDSLNQAIRDLDDAEKKAAQRLSELTHNA